MPVLVDQFFKRDKPAKFTQEEIDILNNSKLIKIELAVKNFPQKKNQGPDSLTEEFTSIVEGELPVLLAGTKPLLLH